MSNLVGVIIVGVLTYVVVDVLVGALQTHLENDKLKEIVKNYEDELKERARVLKVSLVTHNNEIKWYKSRIRELEQQLKEQSQK